MTGEFSEAEPFLKQCYLNVPVLDLTAPTQDQVRSVVDFIQAESARGIVYIHCKIGYSRTAAVAGAWLLGESGLAKTPEMAMSMLRDARPSIIIRPEAEAVIRRSLQPASVGV